MKWSTPTLNVIAVPGPEAERTLTPAVFPARILVTGANGFVGSRLVDRLRVAAPFSQIAPLKGPAPGQPVTENEGLSLDLTDATAVSDAVVGFAPDVVVHLAAFSSVGLGQMQTDQVWSSNFDATRLLAKALSASGHASGRPARMIFASTAEVYGRGFNDGPRDETAAMMPTSTYGRSKAACELLLQDMAGDDLGVVVLRLFNHTGPGQGENFVVPALAAQLARLGDEGDRSIRVGNLEAQRDFTDVEDIIDAYLAVLSGPTEPGVSVYNVGSGRTRAIRTILDTLLRCHGGEVAVIQDPARMRPSEVPLAAGVFDKFAETYGWSARRDFEDTIAAIFDHERERAALP